MQNSNQNTAGFSSKILKYLAELLVVVFGVYLGFKANNYACELTQKDYVNATIKEMYHSLEQDIKDAELNMEGHRKGIVAVQYFFKLVQNKSVDLDSFDIYYHRFARNFISVQNTSPFETIRSKGYNVIANDSLRRKMVKLYDFQYEMLEKIEEKYQPSQIYSNKSHYINEFLDNSLHFDKDLKLVKITLPLDISQGDRSHLILVLKSIYTTRYFNISVYNEVINDMKSLRSNIAQLYPLVLDK
ncbi:MAG TPA: hypothetical protein PKD16_16665 [Saprospiraceae bacterium]|jgi:hypothetical protein|nr:hypothetical protein [Saprospiraceae bacterium]HMT71803.1 hypothetical protein [Saprospiraceae bacterium]